MQRSLILVQIRTHVISLHLHLVVSIFKNSGEIEITCSQEHKLLTLAENQLPAFTSDGSHPPVFQLRGNQRPLQASGGAHIHMHTPTN